METSVGALKSALNKVQKAVHTSSVTLQVADSMLTIHASNGPQGCAKATVTVENSVAFTALVDGNRLSAVLGGADAALPCEIKATKESIRLKFGQANIRFPISNEEVTLLEEARWNGATPIGDKLKGSDLKAAFERVTPFAARGDVRYYLNGVLMTTRGDRLTLVATDGFRLARLKTSLPVSDVPDSIIPIQIADALSSVLDGGSEVQIYTVGDNESRGVGFRTDNFEVICPVIAGAFPKFDGVIPDTRSMIRANVNRKAALAVLDRIGAVAESKGGACYVRVVINDRNFGVLTIDEESKDMTELDAAVSEPMNLGFQPKLLIPALAAVKTDSVCFLYTPPSVDTGKALIRDAEGEAWGVVVMPSRV